MLSRTLRGNWHNNWKAAQEPGTKIHHGWFRPIWIVMLLFRNLPGPACLEHHSRSLQMMLYAMMFHPGIIFFARSRDSSDVHRRSSPVNRHGRGRTFTTRTRYRIWKAFLSWRGGCISLHDYYNIILLYLVTNYYTLKLLHLANFVVIFNRSLSYMTC